MPISDKTRKILWATSGNLCAMCKTTLVIGASESDSASIVGDECHIRSKSEFGPRYDACYPKTELDENGNLLLLCKKDHKLIDDQVNKFSTTVLEKLKSDHENYVKTKIHTGNEIPDVKIIRINDQIPKYLPEIQSGNILANIIGNCHAQLPKYCDGLDDEETEIIGAFLGNLADYADLYSEIGILERMRAAKDIEREIQEIQSRGFRIFAAKERQRIEGGGSEPSRWNAAHILITRDNDTRIDPNNGYRLNS